MKKQLITQSDDLITQGVAKKVIRIGFDVTGKPTKVKRTLRTVFAFPLCVRDSRIGGSHGASQGQEHVLQIAQKASEPRNGWVVK